MLGNVKLKNNKTVEYLSIYVREHLNLQEKKHLNY
jgi:hypothetical protein